MNYPAAVPINYSNTAYFYPDDTGVLGSFTKSVDAKTLVSLDYSSLLSSLTSKLSIKSISFVLNYGSAPQLIVSGATLEPTTNIVTFLVSGGLNGLKYNIQIMATLSDGATVNTQSLEVVVSTPGVTTGNCNTMVPTGGGPPIPDVYQQAQILNGDQTRFGSSFMVFWVSDTAPTTANILDRWYNTTNGLIYDRATDGISVFWVSSTTRPAQYTSGPTPPTAPQQGDMWFDTNHNILNVWINTG